MLTSERQIRLLIREILAEYVVPMGYSLKKWKKVSTKKLRVKVRTTSRTTKPLELSISY